MTMFKDITNYEGRYKVSENGNVKSVERMVKCRGGKTRIIKERILRPNCGPNGYLYVVLSKNGKAKTYEIHK